MKLIRRRNFLQAMSLGPGARLLGPMFMTMLPEALGAPNPNRRHFVLFTHGGGLLVRQYTCTARAATDFDLTPVMAPLAPHKAEMSVLSKFYCPHDKRQHGNQFATLSMMRSADQEYGNYRGFPPGGTSIDRFVAKEIGSQDLFSSTVQAISENGSDAPHLSADGKDNAFPGISSPLKAFETYFAQGAMPSGVSATAIIAQNKSLFDFIRGDVSKMKTRLAAPERVKLDQYIDSVQGLEQQLAKLADQQTQTCQLPTKPSGNNGLDPLVIDAHLAVLTAAHRCGITHVSHFSLHGFSSPHNRYGWLGDTRGFHDDHHDNDAAMIDKIVTFTFEKVASLVDGFKKTPQTSGSMLDNSLIAFLNTCGGQHHDGHDTYSAFFFGKAGGALKTGRYHTYPVKQHSLGDLWLTAANAVGSKATVFGDPAHCKGPLTDILV
jgi:hypothetical protein